ncbi:preprotein translocase YidC [Plantactinospora soyae]|uniref:Preprotein translocase YidC n=1 Tax=Plantactinospora soyae TaxID=1544732 RepID=A0A927R941_9ACTN|nr:preprotein translocase YidC [Plantactinospora soyae]MBE1491039.1 hypothetical protein [Plantactinospora soyae]
MGYRARQGEQPVDPDHAEDEDGQARLTQVVVETPVPAPSGTDERPDIVTEDDNSGVAGGASGGTGGSAATTGHPDSVH